MTTKFTLYVDETVDGYRVDLIDNVNTVKLNPESKDELFRIIKRLIQEQEDR